MPEAGIAADVEHVLRIIVRTLVRTYPRWIKLLDGARDQRKRVRGRLPISLYLSGLPFHSQLGAMTLSIDIDVDFVEAVRYFVGIEGHCVVAGPAKDGGI